MRSRRFDEKTRWPPPTAAATSRFFPSRATIMRTTLVMTLSLSLASAALALALPQKSPFPPTATATGDDFASINTTELDRKMRRIAIEYSRSILGPSWEAAGRSDALDEQILNACDALRLGGDGPCEGEGTEEGEGGTSKAHGRTETERTRALREQRSILMEQRRSLMTFCDGPDVHCTFVEPGNDDGTWENGSRKTNRAAEASKSSGAERSDGGDVGGEESPPDGSIVRPFRCLHEALGHSRAARRRLLDRGGIIEMDGRRHHHRPTSKIILRGGIHSLGRSGTLRVGGTDDADLDDSNLEILGYPGEDVWISGGISIPDSTPWTPWGGKNGNKNSNILTADLTPILPPPDRQQRLPKIVSLFTTSPHRRLVRARYPNGDFEVTNHRGEDYLPTASLVTEWVKPPKSVPPTFTYVDLRNHRPPKNDSTMTRYNMYASGSGGACDEIWGGGGGGGGDDGDGEEEQPYSSYWCSNASAGGWAEVDRGAAISGRMQIPAGLSYNASHESGRRFVSWEEEKRREFGEKEGSASAAKGGIVHAWHSQHWAMHMFEIEEHDLVGHGFRFARGGGNQGGRNWCRCDQCTGSGRSWCGQFDDPKNNSDTRLVGNNWLVENVLPELDDPGEYYFDRSSGRLYIIPNVTTTTGSSIGGVEDGIAHDGGGGPPHPPPPPRGLRLALLETIMDLRNATNVTLSNVGFRDAAPTYLGHWSAPSGGDWSLHRGGAVFLEDVRGVTVRDCTFRRLDGTAVFLSRRTRDVTVERSTFEWLGENAVATWGETDGFDATSGRHPMNTVLRHNVMRELGIYQKQSSGYGHAKAATSTVVGNLMFNMPRAAVNFNDMMGGGDVVTRNVIFNTCRESGDHGPINTWDRQPFMTSLRDGETNSFDPLPRTISKNLIFANYGAGQGVDNDDGSSWYRIASNVFYWADGFKMDYGGHDSVFEDNLVVSYGKKKCIGFGSFLPGHGHVVRRNRCIVGLNAPPQVSKAEGGNGVAIGALSKASSSLSSSSAGTSSVADLYQCINGSAHLEDNLYYTPNGTAIFTCHDVHPNGDFTLQEFRRRYNQEVGSASFKTPNVQTLLDWTHSTLK